MPEPNRPSNQDDRVDAAARAFGQEILGRELSAAEADALGSVLRASAEALRHGSIAKLAEHVQAERADESIEEFVVENLDLS